MFFRYVDICLHQKTSAILFSDLNSHNAAVSYLFNAILRITSLNVLYTIMNYSTCVRLYIHMHTVVYTFKMDFR